MTDTVSSILGTKHYNDELFGIEIELEGMDLPELDSTLVAAGWNIKRDGSLKQGGFEYYFRGPLDYKGTIKAINALYDKLSSYKPIYSNRTATHVHYNVSNLEWTKLWDVIAVNLMFEELLLAFCEDERRGNMFCLSVSDAPGILKSMVQDKEKGTVNTFLRFDDYKYANLNVAAAGRYGTIEYRCLEAVKDKNRLVLWLNAISAINKFAIEYPMSAENYITAASLAGPEKFAKQVMGDAFAPFKDMKVADLMMKGIRNAQVLAFTPNGKLAVKPRRPVPERREAEPFVQWADRAFREMEAEGFAVPPQPRPVQPAPRVRARRPLNEAPAVPVVDQPNEE